MKRILEILNVIRLAGFAIGYGLTGALIGGTLNRIMVAEIGLPLSLVGLFFAVPMLITPLRVWLGYRSDGYVLFGKRREPYMLIGAAIVGAAVIITVIITVNAATTPLMIAAMLLAFMVYGFGRNLAHNTFQALLADKFSDHAKRRAITLYEVVTLLGLVMGAGGLGKALETYDPQRLITVTIGTVVVMFILTVIATLGNEAPLKNDHVARARELPFSETLKQFALADKQVRLFFVIIMFTIVGTLAQDVVLEPYGALVLNMEVGETTRLTSYWGLGVVFAMLSSGIVLVRYLGFVNLLRIGLICSALAFLGVIFTGLNGQAQLFKQLVFLMGLGTGVAGAGMLSGFVTFTTAARAGFLMGIWGIANMLGRALGSLMGGLIVDGMYVLTADHFTAYAVVFAIEIVMLVVALSLTFRLVLSNAPEPKSASSLVPEVA
jgi:BCD family chlorophyll transporter-like MFS transporter